jgi:hypothetical protein
MFQRTQSQMPATDRRNLICLVVILVGFTLFSLFSGGGTPTCAFGETALTLTGPDEGSVPVVINYEEIRSLSLTDDLDLGTFVDGANTTNCQFGTWENEQFGQYTLCALPSVKTYLVMDTEDGIVVLNCESANTTSHLCEAIQGLLDEQTAAS